MVRIALWVAILTGLGAAALILGLGKEAAHFFAAEDTAKASEWIKPHKRKSRPLRIEFEDGQGRALTLSDFRGKLVVLNLWATWCAPCVEELPSLDRLQKAFSDREFAVVALSLDRGGVEVVKAFYKANDIEHLKIYSDPSMQAMASMGAEGLPFTVILDAKGREIGRVIGGRDWSDEDTRDMIEAILDAEEEGD